MAISFAGQPLLITDSADKIADWFEKWLPTSDGRMICDWPEPEGCFSGTSVYYTGQPLPAPNWSKPLEPKIGSWYCPVGASRWSYGFFLTDYEHLYGGTANVSASQSILGQVGQNNNPQPLVLEAPTGHKRTWSQCYLLPPHPVSAEGFSNAGLWLLPIVDERWYWQFATGFETAIDLTQPAGQTWQQLFNSIANFLGVSLSVDTVDPKYLYPNPFVLVGTSPHSAAHILDACAYSVGQRIVPNYGASGSSTTFAGSTWRSQNWTNSLSQKTTNLAGSYDAGILQSGGASTFPNQSAIAPATVVVAFRTYKNGIVVGDWKTSRYLVTVSAANAGWGGGTTGDFSATVCSTALANFSQGNPNPDNYQTLQNLANQIATDYYAGIWIQDSCRVGISQWQETGYDDYVEFNIGERFEDGSMCCKTRIHSRPYNEVFDQMLHYDTSTWEYGDKLWGTLDGTLAANGTQTVTVTGCDGAIPAGTNHITVTEVMGSVISSGTKIVALRMGDKWAALESTGGFPAVVGVGQCTSLVTAGNTGTFSFAASGGASVSAQVPYGITRANTNYLVCGTDAGTYYVLNPDKILYGQFSSAVVAGSSGTLTIFVGTLGSETTSGVTVTAWVRRGACVGSRTYIVGYTSSGFEVLNPDGLLLGQGSLTNCTSGTSVTMTLFSGSQGSESTQSVTVSAYVRKGVILPNQTYEIVQNCNGFEVINPSLTIRGQPSADVAADATGDLVVYTGTGSGTASAVTITGIRNDSSCVVKTGKLASAQWHDSLNNWVYSIFHVN